MKITIKKKREIIQKVTHAFSIFGGGQTSSFNPLTVALKDKKPMFAAGVDVEQVVEFVLKNI